MGSVVLNKEKDMRWEVDMPVEELEWEVGVDLIKIHCTCVYTYICMKLSKVVSTLPLILYVGKLSNCVF